MNKRCLSEKRKHRYRKLGQLNPLAQTILATHKSVQYKSVVFSEKMSFLPVFVAGFDSMQISKCALFFGLMLIGVVVGCGGGDSGEPTAGAPPAPAPTSSDYGAYNNAGKGGPPSAGGAPAQK